MRLQHECTHSHHQHRHRSPADDWASHFQRLASSTRATATRQTQRPWLQATQRGSVHSRGANGADQLSTDASPPPSLQHEGDQGRESYRFSRATRRQQTGWNSRVSTSWIHASTRCACSGYTTKTRSTLESKVGRRFFNPLGNLTLTKPQHLAKL